MLKEKLIYILAWTVLPLFVIMFNKKHSVRFYLTFVLFTLPFLDLRTIPEAWGGLKVFDVITFYSFLFLLKEFSSVGTIKSNNFFILLFLMLIIIALFGSLCSEFPKNSLMQFPKIFSIFIYARFLIIECLYDTSFYYKVIRILKIGYVISLSFLLIQMIVGLNFTFYPGLNGNTYDIDTGLIRYPGLFYDSQTHGQYLAMGSFLFLMLDHGMNRKEVLLHYFILAASLFAIIVAGSRSAFGGYCISMIISFFLAGKRYRVWMFTFMILAVSFYGLFSLSSGVFNRTKNLNDDYAFRQSIWKEAFEVAKSHTLLGIGNGNYLNYVKIHLPYQYLEVEGGELVYFDQPENGYLKVLVELGFIGFGIFILFIVIPLIKGLSLFIRKVHNHNIIFLIGSVLSWIIAFNTVYSIGDVRILFMVVTLLVLILSYPRTDKFSHEEV